MRFSEEKELNERFCQKDKVIHTYLITLTLPLSKKSAFNSVKLRTFEMMVGSV